MSHNGFGRGGINCELQFCAVSGVRYVFICRYLCWPALPGLERPFLGPRSTAGTAYGLSVGFVDLCGLLLSARWGLWYPELTGNRIGLDVERLRVPQPSVDDHDHLKPLSPFGLRNRYLSRLGVQMPDHCCPHLSSLAYRSVLNTEDALGISQAERHVSSLQLCQGSSRNQSWKETAISRETEAIHNIASRNCCWRNSPHSLVQKRERAQRTGAFKHTAYQNEMDPLERRAAEVSTLHHSAVNRSQLNLHVTQSEGSSSEADDEFWVLNRGAKALSVPHLTLVGPAQTEVC
ncbi:hypothetical protein QQF64_008019 [Cirrhinus molitorella]|uniref:Uncharacterized protein n=1 Tax=Cirrhinus molitorella TaxID=172907 RepID=A0ABR3M4Z6_9TELE